MLESGDFHRDVCECDLWPADEVEKLASSVQRRCPYLFKVGVDFLCSDGEVVAESDDFFDAFVLIAETARAFLISESPFNSLGREALVGVVLS